MTLPNLVCKSTLDFFNPKILQKQTKYNKIKVVKARKERKKWKQNKK